MDVQEMKTVAELNPQNPPPFVSATDNLTPPMDDAAVRAIFEAATKSGVEDLNTPIQTAPPQPVGQPIAQEPVKVQPVEVPAKFQKPDGTVDEDKLNASSKQLDTAIEQRHKTIDELVAEYKAKEKQLHELGAQKNQVQQQVQSLPIPNNVPQQPLQDPNAEALRQRILRDFQNDPIGTMVEIARVVSAKEVEPIAAVAQVVKEQEQDTRRRSALTEIASQDPRILQHYDMVSKILYEEEPEMLKLKNPYKAAWNEAKGRLRLGEPAPVQAQPSNATPTLGRGAPASTFGMPVQATPQNLGNAIHNANMKNPQENAVIEAELRRLTNHLWQQ